MNKYCFNLVVEFRRIAWVLSSALLLCVPTYGQVPAAGSLGITVKNEGAGSHTQWLAPAANEVIGFDASGQLVSKTSGGAWGGITGTLSAQVDLQSVLSAKAPLVSPTFTGTVTIPSGASISGYLTTAAAAGAYQPLSETLTNLTGVTVDPFGASLLELIGAEGLRNAAELGTLATQNGVISDYTLGATSSTDNALVRFDGATGKVVQNSVATLSDGGALSLPGPVSITGEGNALSVTGNVSFGYFSSYPHMSVNWPTNGAMTVSDVFQFIWSFNDSYFDGGDLGLKRKSPSLLQITNGSTGYGALDLSSLQFSGGPTVRAGSGPPEGSVTAPVGSVYTRTDGSAGTTLYTKESGIGNTGWRAVLSGVVPVTLGGTGTTTASDARTALGLTIGTDVLAPNGSGASLTSLNASALSTGTVGTARLGAGTASSSNFLRGDGTWATPSGTGDVVGPGSATDNALLVFDGTSGKVVKNTSIITFNEGTGLFAQTMAAGLISVEGSSGEYTVVAANGLGFDAGSGYFQIKPHETTGSWTLTLPENNGDSGQALITDGSGNTSWSAIGGGTVTSVSVSGSDGIEIDSGAPITYSGTIALGINAATLANHLNLATTYQPLDDRLTDLSGLAPTKGRLIVGDGTNWVDLGVGTDDQVLTVDSGVDKGVKWATPSSSGATFVDVQVFTTSGTWIKPAGASSVKIIMVGGGGGGGGGSGRRGAADTERSGGGGGGTGSSWVIECLASDLAATESVVVGVGGSGAAGVTTDDTIGIEGDTGGSTTFNIFIAAGGDGGNGGYLTAGSGGLVRNYSSGGPRIFDQQALAGGAGSNGSGANAATSAFMIRPTGGGGGGGLRDTNARGGGGAGGIMLSSSPVVSTIAGGAAGSSGTSNNGGDGIAFLWTGTGGGGGLAGSSDASVAGGNGGDGGGPGAGGGGGGASTNGAGSGAGGDGADGYVRIETLIQN